MKEKFQTLRQRINKKMAEFNLVLKRYREESKALEVTQSRIGDAREAQTLAQQVAQQVQKHAHDQIANVVSKCLEAVFDEPYKFKIHFERKRGRTEAKLVFERDGSEIDPMQASGGGIIDVASFALRLSCLMLAKPPLRKILILDEPFKFISSEYRERVRVLLENLAKEMGVQFILITHIEEFKTGQIVQL